MSIQRNYLFGVVLRAGVYFTHSESLLFDCFTIIVITSVFVCALFVSFFWGGRFLLFCVVF